ncbi:RE1 [Symbiodinium sp. CCMP2592]|nr:RE1 [Symbiodinium sp. CCMP2592]
MVRTRGPLQTLGAAAIKLMLLPSLNAKLRDLLLLLMISLGKSKEMGPQVTGMHLGLGQGKTGKPGRHAGTAEVLKMEGATAATIPPTATGRLGPLAVDASRQRLYFDLCEYQRDGADCMEQFFMDVVGWRRGAYSGFYKYLRDSADYVDRGSYYGKFVEWRACGDMGCIYRDCAPVFWRDKGAYGTAHRPHLHRGHREWRRPWNIGAELPETGECLGELAPDQRALVLYQHLSGSAWVNSESLNVEDLAHPEGVARLREWIRQHYLDVEVTQVGRSLSDLFRKLRRRPQQSFRDYAAEFNRLLARVIECGCALPDVANAWLFVDRANLDEATEVSLLASVGNKYALKALQSAAIVLDRSMRKPWEKAGLRGKPQSVNQTDDLDGGEASDVEPPLHDDPECNSEELYLTYMTAKARYKESAKARGTDYRTTEADSGGMRKAAEAKIQLAKAKSHCSACGQRGHWHRDAICPKFPGNGNQGPGAKAQTIHVTNEVFELTTGTREGLKAILDSACSKTVVGTGWLQKYLDYVKGSGYDVVFVYEKESFKFGAASRIYESTYAAVILVPLLDHIIAIKASVIHGDIPLLLSRPALARLGLVLDLGSNVATFRALDGGEVELEETTSGHPAVVVDHSKLAKPDTSRLPDNWEPHGIAILGPREVYMVACSGDVSGDDQRDPGDVDAVTKIFYDKKIDGAVRDMLTGDVLNEDLFVTCGLSKILASIQHCGSAAVCSIELNLLPLRVPSIMLPVWKMTKAQLIDECKRRQLAFNEAWTCPELRTILIADREYETKRKGVAVPKGLSSMNLDELKAEAHKMELTVKSGDTNGSLMLRIRDAAAPADTVMTIGRFRGTTFAQIPDNYGDWASEKERQNGTNMHNDLKRFVMWRRHRRSKGQNTPAAAASTMEPTYLDAETYATVPPPPISETGSSSWAMVADYESAFSEGYNPRARGRPALWREAQTPVPAAKPKHRSAKTKTKDSEGPERMEQEIDPATMDEIQALEARLATLRDRFSDRVLLVRKTRTMGSLLRDTEVLEVLRPILEKTLPELHFMNGILLSEAKRCNLGYYAYGTFKGVGRRTTEWPKLTTYLNEFLADCIGESGHGQGRATWAALALLGDIPTGVHTDRNNLKGSFNYLVSFGSGNGGGVWIQEKGGGTWRRSGNGQEIEGRIVDAHEQGWEFDPRLAHATEPFDGERWFLAGYTPRSFPEASKSERKILNDLKFPVPTKAEIREIKKRDDYAIDIPEKEIAHEGGSGSRPKRSVRKGIRRTAMMLSVLFTTAISTMCGVVRDALPAHVSPATAILEVGGLSATCRLAEYDICGDHLVEPLLPEDVLSNDHPEDLGIGYIEAAVVRHRPGQLWIHMIIEWGCDAVFRDLVEAISYQLGRGQAVVLEREVEEPLLWESLANGWEDAGYDVTYDFTEDGHQYIRVVQAQSEGEIHSVYVGDNESEEELLPAQSEERGAEDEGPLPRGARAISFPPTVSETIATSLRRLHQNLGHPSTADFVRHLRLAGASREVLKGAKALECQVCQRSKQPAIPKPAKIVPCYRFNEMVGTDLFYVHDSEGRRHQLLSIVDFSSAYHIVVPVQRKDTVTLEKAFCESWVQIFGAPTTVAVDLENGLEKSLARIGDWTGTRIRSAAGQAHHQAGYTERQGAIWKSLFSRICEEHSVCQSDFHLAVSAVSSAKNQLTRTSGFSPCQHVFGSMPGLPEDLLEGPHADHPEQEAIIDDKHAREVALRTAARAAYFHVQTDERVRRALAGRARVESRTPETGERVFYFRKTKNNKKGYWVGPGTVIGREGANLWITRAGRCVLCAPEHVRLATGEELGQAFSMKVAQEDLDKLLNADSDEPGAYDEDHEDQGDEEMLNAGAAGVGEIVYDMELDGEEERRGLRRDLVRVPPRVLKRQRRKGRGEEAAVDGGPREGPSDVNMIKRARTQRSREKQLEKEIPWSLIPEFMRPKFREKEMVQWREHVDTGALEVLSVEESERVRREEPASRILGSRFAYRDKHLGRRRADPTVEWKPKSRLVVAGHLDPDVGVANIEVDSPTVSRASLISLLQICASKRWKAAAGDVQAAFLQGVELGRQLWMAQPKSGISGLDPRQLARIRKGVFGLSESPRMWYDRLSGVLLSEVFDIGGVRHRLVPSPLDPCVMMLIKDGEASEPAGYLALHVDDILVVAPTEVNRMLQGRIGRLFPIDGWLEDSFEYVGSFIQVNDDGVSITQESFVDGRLFTVEVPRSQKGTEPATEEQAIDNRSLIGALSWLSSQSRPDLTCGVALSQQLQRAPLTEDVRFVNQLSARAKEFRENGIYLRPTKLEDAVFLVYHDAAWANAELEEAEDGFKLTAEEIEQGTIRGFYSESRPRKAKKGSSKVASQLGHLILLADRAILDGSCCRTSLLEWRSQSCKRVCRSTFGAETMAAVEGLEGGQYMRALLASLLHGRIVKHHEIRKRWPILCLSDCKSLHDHLHKAGTPRLPADRRLAIDLAALRQELRAEQWTDRLPLQWRASRYLLKEVAGVFQTSSPKAHVIEPSEKACAPLLS